MFEPERVVGNPWTTSRRDGMNELCGCCVRVIYLDEACTGIQRWKRKRGGINLRNPLGGSHLPGHALETGGGTAVV
jgi:hypothetical protein